MAHFAELDENNIVKQVIVVNNNELLDNGVESESKGIAFCQSLFGGNWIQTSYNGSFRKNFAGIDFTYDPVRDAFIPPKPALSWLLNEETCQWYPPVPMPIDDNQYMWVDDFQEWWPTTGMPDSGFWRWNAETNSWEEYDIDEV